MRLSDLMNKSGARPQRPRKEQDTPPSSPAVPAKPEPADEAVPSSPAGHTAYQTVPDAIYEAARELDIPIPQNRETTVQQARNKLSKIFTVALDPASNKDGLWERVREIANDLSVVLALDSNFARVVQRHTSQDERLLSHSINSAVIAMDFARDVEKAEHSPHEIGTAALLHDIGIVALGLKLDAGEGKKSKEHVARSVELVREMKVPEAVATMIAQHHERTDGSGYPEKLKEGDILISSQIVALAERFERAMCSPSDAKSSDGALNCVQLVLAELRTALDPDVLKAFIALRGFYPDGTIVELTNRSVCLVIRQNEGFPLRPVVQVVVDGAGNHPSESKIIDLRTSRTLSIIRAVTDDGAFQ